MADKLKIAAQICISSKRNKDRVFACDQSGSFFVPVYADFLSAMTFVFS